MAADSATIHLSGGDLPSDTIVRRYQSREALSRPFEVEIEFHTKDKSFHVDKLLRKALLLSLVDAQGRSRCFHGIVDRAEFLEVHGDHIFFRVLLRPALWALRFRENSKIWQFKAIVDVIKDVIKGAGIADDEVEWKTYNDYEPREFCVQYRESELDFISRLMEDDGLFYFFRHTPAGHKLIIADAPDAFEPSDDAPEVKFAMTPGLEFDGEPLTDFSRTRSLRTSSVVLRDYDFEKPDNPPHANNPVDEKWRMPLYEYPGGFVKTAAGKRRAAARLSERRRDSDTCRGNSGAIGMRCGVPFNVEGGEPEWINGPYVCIELLTYGEQASEDGTEGGENFVCRNAFVGIPEASPWAPPRITPKPRIRGIQTAVVTGSTDHAESIHVDKYGRIKVRFHWDRIGQEDHNSSCWLRVQQPITGGTIVLPRVGWELAIAFFDGDPDRPFALGRIYNGEQMVPYALPGAAATGSMKTHSTPGGAGHNEVKMSDTGGSQGFGIHAQKDLNISVGNDRSEKIGVNEEHNVKVNMNATVGGNEEIHVGSIQNLTVGAELSHKISGSQTIEAGIEMDNSTANYVEKISGARSYTVSGAMVTICNGIKTVGKAGITRNCGAVEVKAAVGSISTHVGGSYTETVSAVKAELIKGVSSETVGGMKTHISSAAEVHLVDGNHASSCKSSITNLVGGLHWQNLGGAYSVKAPMITLLGATGSFKAGGSEIKMGSSGLAISGSKLAIKSAILIKMGSSLKMGSGG